MPVETDSRMAATVRKRKRRAAPAACAALTATLFVLAVPRSAHAQSLLELYEAAHSYDATYLSARALSKVAPALEPKIWADYKAELTAAISEGGAPAWPTGCNRIDIIEDKLFTNLPYMQGAF